MRGKSVPLPGAVSQNRKQWEEFSITLLSGNMALEIKFNIPTKYVEQLMQDWELIVGMIKEQISPFRMKTKTGLLWLPSALTSCLVYCRQPFWSDESGPCGSPQVCRHSSVLFFPMLYNHPFRLFLIAVCVMHCACLHLEIRLTLEFISSASRFSQQLVPINLPSPQ